MMPSGSPNGPQPLEGEGHVALAGLGLQRVWRGHNDIPETVHPMMEHGGGNDAGTP